MLTDSKFEVFVSFKIFALVETVSTILQEILPSVIGIYKKM